MIYTKVETIVFEYPDEYDIEAEWVKAGTADWRHISQSTKSSRWAKKEYFRIGRGNNDTEK